MPPGQVWPMSWSTSPSTVHAWMRWRAPSTEQRATTQEPVQLLPLFDPYLLGHATHDHLFEPIHAPKVSRTAGWISAVVLVDGSVAGTWTHTVAKNTLSISVQPFRRLTSSVTAVVRRRAKELALALDQSKTEVTFG